MSVVDFKIERKARGLFTRLGINMQHIDISVVRQVVYINGYATYERSASPVLKKDIAVIINEIKKSPEVRDIVLQLGEPPVIKKKPEERLIPGYLAKKKEQEPDNSELQTVVPDLIRDKQVEMKDIEQQPKEKEQTQ